MKQAPSPLFPFEHPKIAQTAMPMGGIGAGCICLNGHGGLQDYSIRNHPETTALLIRDSQEGADAAFGLLHIKSPRPITRLLEGPLPKEKVYDQGIWGTGYRRGGHEGLPRFERCRFESGYPFGRVSFSDRDVPLEVSLIGWSPFVPLDDIASGLPCSILEYNFHNNSKRPVSFEFSYHLSHLAPGSTRRWESTRNSVIPGKGVFFSNTEPGGSESHGSASLTAIGHRPQIKAMWLRGEWFDAISSLWREVDTGKFTTNDGKESAAGRPDRNGGSIQVKATLAPGESRTIPVVITWHFPNSNLYYRGWWWGHPEEVAPPIGDTPRWRTFYASQWADAGEVANYVHRHYRSLRERTVAFQRALFTSTLPREVLDAVSANLAILKSPTILRQENGNLWAWEGCNPSWGSCAGSCTHVWNYAQALPHLFPKLERTLREQELKRSMDEQGHVTFRAALPDGSVPHYSRAAADGQLGGIMKVYRDWQITGDGVWLAEMYPLAKRSLDYCIGQWDPDRLGGLFEPHHNTYDIEFWGPDGMCGTIYLGALCALAEMAAALGEAADQKAYSDLAARCARFLETELFNGEYFYQRVQYRGLRDTSFVEKIEGRKAGGESGEMLSLLKKEGPRYQYGEGCLSDGVIGAWMAEIYGIPIPLDRGKIRANLRAVHRHNFKRSLQGHANCQRPGYALPDEGGLLLCSWPRGGKPTLPFVYSDEVWTGIEYQVASHLISEGLVEEGLEIVRTTRARHDGGTRNPWNEYECGNYYARALASYSLLGSLSGFRYSAVEGILWFGPKRGKLPFTTFFSAASGYGSITLGKKTLTLSLLEGRLPIKTIRLNLGKRTEEIAVNRIATPRRPLKLDLP